MNQDGTPAGWYPDGNGQERWWDGSGWTDHVRPPAQAAPAAPASYGQPPQGQQGYEQQGYGQQSYGGQPYGAPSYGAGYGAPPRRSGPSWKVLGPVIGAVLVAIIATVVLVVTLGGDDDSDQEADDRSSEGGSGGSGSDPTGSLGESSPTDATSDEFCEAYLSIFEYFEAEGETFQAGDYAEVLAEAGTPEDIPDDAREGFEIYVDAFEELGNDAVEEDADAIEFSSAQEDSTDAFDDYVGDACVGSL